MGEESGFEVWGLGRGKAPALEVEDTVVVPPGAFGSAVRNQKLGLRV